MKIQYKNLLRLENNKTKNFIHSVRNKLNESHNTFHIQIVLYKDLNHTIYKIFNFYIVLANLKITAPSFVRSMSKVKAPDS